MAAVIRPTYTTRAVSAGCSVCGAVWSAANAQGVAARHCDATGHRTWVSVSESIEYGELVAGSDEPTLFDDGGPCAECGHAADEHWSRNGVDADRLPCWYVDEEGCRCSGYRVDVPPNGAVG